MITVIANSRSASCRSDDLITSGSVGIPVTLELSHDFDGLSCVVVFSGSGGETRDVIPVDSACVVPHECVASDGDMLRIGVYGRNAEGTIVIPTIWAGFLPILKGAEPSDIDPSEPTPDWTAQVQQLAADAYDMAEDVQERADRGEFDGEQGPVGPVGPQGERGLTGETGATGATPDLTIGAVDTLPAGSRATATITGTDEEPVLNLGIPQGEKGVPGQDGATGPSGEDGVSPTVTVTDITGGHRVTVTDADGAHSFDVMDGEDYVLTQQDKADIAAMVDVPVQDVQVNGTSVLVDGVANVPVAGSSDPGVVEVNPAGESIGFVQTVVDGVLVTTPEICVIPATNTQIKSMIGAVSPITANKINRAAFYGLARAAGDTTQSASSNAVGTYTDEAKIAIQKMLGIYQPPWELLNDITLTEESGLDLTADANGTPYDLLGVYIRVYYAANLATASTGYARYMFDNMDGHYINAETGKYVTATNVQCKFIHVMREGTLAMACYSIRSSTGSGQPWQIKDLNSNGYNFNFGNIVRIRMNAADVEPAGTRIQIYGQRAY